MNEMHHIQISPSSGLHGTVSVPGDKSISHRAVILGSISSGTTHINGFLSGEDCLSTISCFQKMGVDFEIKGADVLVHGIGMHGLKAPCTLLDTGNSGTTTRLLSGLLSGQRFDSVLDGDDSIRRRPMNRVIIPLSKMGASIESRKGGLCPLHISGRELRGIDYTMPVASAQLKSALLLAGLYAGGKTTVTEPRVSRDHTELMLKMFGADILRRGKSVTVCHCDNLAGQNISIPGDISSAAYFLAAGLIVPGSEITVKNVGINPTRTGIIDVIRAMGGTVEYSNVHELSEPSADITVRSSKLCGTVIEGDLIPRLIDELPVIAVMAACARGTTVIRNAEELKVKESNRISVMTQELLKAGIDVKETADGMIIRDGRRPKAASFDSSGDHRIAMSCAVLALVCDGTSEIVGSDCINISFPGFYQLLSAINE